MIYVPRTIEPLIHRTLRQFPALAVTGPRQSGKSTLLKTILGKTHQYISFDSPLVRERALSDPALFLDSLSERVIIDEIQYAPQLLSYVKIAIDDNRRKMGRFVFTGSQQFNLIKNLGESLAGRIGLLELLPFDMSEKRSIPSLKKKLDSGLSAFVDACLVGAYPEIAVHRRKNTSDWYSSYIATYLERDIKSIYDIGSLRDFHRFLQLMAARTAQILNLSSLAGDLGVAVNTVKKWVSILEASRIIYILPPYYQNFGKRVTKSPKVYFLDCGLVCHLTGIQTKPHLMNGPMAGALFENFCIQETVKTLLFKGVVPRLFYYRSNTGLEVDLLLEHQAMRVIPVEMKLTQSPRPAMADSIRRLKKLLPKLRWEKGRLVCLSNVDFSLTREVDVLSLNSYINELALIK